MPIYYDGVEQTDGFLQPSISNDDNTFLVDNFSTDDVIVYGGSGDLTFAFDSSDLPTDPNGVANWEWDVNQYLNNKLISTVPTSGSLNGSMVINYVKIKQADGSGKRKIKLVPHSDNPSTFTSEFDFTAIFQPAQVDTSGLQTQVNNLQAQVNAMPKVTAGVTNTVSVAAGAAVDVAINFPTGLFAAVPELTYSLRASNADPLYTMESGVTAISTTGATVHLVNKGSSLAYVMIDWSAIK